MKTGLKTLQEFETIYADKLVKDIANTEGHIIKLTARADEETNQAEKSRLLALVTLHTNHKTKLLNTDSKIEAVKAKDRQDEMLPKLSIK
jgi:hypothetical protein